MYGTRVFYGDRVLGNNLSLDEPYALKRNVTSYEIGKATVLTAATAKAGQARREGAREGGAVGGWEHVRMGGLSRNASETGSESSYGSNNSLTLANEIGTAKGNLTSSNPLVLRNAGGREGGRKGRREAEEISNEEAEDQVNVEDVEELKVSSRSTPRSAVGAR